MWFKKNWMKNRVVHIFLCLTFFTIFTISSPLSSSADQKRITIVRGQNFPPYHHLDKDGREAGFVIETIIETARLTGIEVEFKQFPWSRCLNMVKTGQVDAMMNLFKTQEREKTMFFHDNIIAWETNVFFVRTTSSAKFDGNYNNIDLLRLAAIRNYSYGKTFDKYPFKNKVELETENELINSLINQRSDIIIGNKLTIKRLLANKNLDSQIKVLTPDISRDPLYLGFSKKKGHEQLSIRFSDNLIKFKSSDQYEKMLTKYSLQE